MNGSGRRPTSSGPGSLAISYTNLGLLYRRQPSQTSKAEAAWQEAVTLREQLARANPTVSQFQSDLAAIYNNLGDWFRETKQLTKAAALHQQALDIRAQLVRLHPTVLEFQRNLAKSHSNLGIMYQAASQMDK